VIEGESADGDIGVFRGRALATALQSFKPCDLEDPLFLVDDRRKDAPVWVRRNDIRRSVSELRAGQAVIGYFTIGRVEEPEAVAKIETACRDAGWVLTQTVHDRAMPRALERPGLHHALTQIARGRARGLVVDDLQGATHSVRDLGVLLEWFRDAGAVLVALDLDLNTATEHGDELAAAVIRLSRWEREKIAEGTRRGVARAKAEGRALGQPSVSDQPQLLERIARLREAGLTLQAIADRLNAEDVPTMRGGTRWRPSSVQSALGYRRPATRRPDPQLPPI